MQDEELPKALFPFSRLDYLHSKQANFKKLLSLA